MKEKSPDRRKKKKRRQREEAWTREEEGHQGRRQVVEIREEHYNCEMWRRVTATVKITMGLGPL